MINRKCWTAALCLGLMTLLGGDRLRAADRQLEPWNEVKGKLEAEGWKSIATGVFERQLGADKVEHLGYGREGLAWTIGDLNRQLAAVTEEYRKLPSDDLAKAIDHLSQTIANAKREMRNLPKSLTLNPMVAGASCSSICYSATANAYALTATQGVGAVADATFNSTCGYSGDTYAYAYAVATLSGTTTTVSQSDPHTGTSVSSHAAASVNGGSVTGTPCASNANSYAQSTALGISYSTSATNSSCPAPANPTVSITGTTYEYFATLGCRSRTFTSTVSGGTPPYTYQWMVGGSVVGTGSSYTRSICAYYGSFTVDLTVTDANGHAGYAPSHDVFVDYSNDCNPTCQ